MKIKITILIILTLGLSILWVSKLNISRSVVIVINHAELVSAGSEVIPNGEEGHSPSKPEEILGEFTAYNPDPEQTDDEPLIMASTKEVYDGAIANNCLPFGTEIILDGKTYIVDDRMNIRYDCDVFDIFLTSKEEAIKWGRQKKKFKKNSDFKPELLRARGGKSMF